MTLLALPITPRKAFLFVQVQRATDFLQTVFDNVEEQVNAHRAVV